CLYAGRLKQLLAGPGEPLRHSLVASQPRQLLQPWATAVLAPDPPTRNMQYYSILEQRQVAHAANRRFVDLPTARTAVLTRHDLAGRLQIQRQRAAFSLGPLHPFQPIAGPAA